jgi:RNA polymerase sigma-70 factor (ECF subfamily)
MSGRPEDDILVELRVGGEAALAEWFGRERPRLERVVRFRLDPRLSARADPEDVLQEAYLDAAKRLASYLDRPVAPFFVWLRGIVLNTLIDLHRRHLGAQRRDAGREISFLSDGASSSESDSPAASLTGGLTSPSQAAIRGEVAADVAAALDRLDEMDRETLYLRHFEQLSNGELAAVLGLSASAASNRYARAIVRLREAMSLALSDH